jgi:hypothetical protein
MKAMTKIGFGLLMVVGLVALATAQDRKEGHGEHPKEGAKQHEHPGDHPAGGDDMAAMMEAFVKAATPGPHHDHLKPLVGKWDAVGKFRFSPEAPWEESRSKAVFEWIMGGRFLTQKVMGKSMMPGMPSFEGFGILGYDNGTEKYKSVWLDNYGTMIMGADGACDATGKTITFKSTYKDPMSGQPTWMKTVYKIESNERFVLSMYGPNETGEEFLSMELTYTRTG